MKILVVEDELSVREILCEFLCLIGHDVLEACDAFQGLGFASTRGDAIGLVISDVDMPRMTGPEMWRIMRNMVPQRNVLFISGRQPLEPSEEYEALTKPFSLETLQEKVSALAAKSSASNLSSASL